MVSPVMNPLIVVVGMVFPSMTSAPPKPAKLIEPLATLPMPSSSSPPLISVLVAEPPESMNALPPLLMVVPKLRPPDPTYWRPLLSMMVPLAVPEPKLK